MLNLERPTLCNLILIFRSVTRKQRAQLISNKDKIRIQVQNQYLLTNSSEPF